MQNLPGYAANRIINIGRLWKKACVDKVVRDFAFRHHVVNACVGQRGASFFCQVRVGSWRSWRWWCVAHPRFSRGQPNLATGES